MQQYRAPRWLIGGNAQTVWPALFGRRFEGAAPVYTRERWTAPDGDFIDVDWQPAVGHAVAGAASASSVASAAFAASAAAESAVSDASDASDASASTPCDASVTPNTSAATSVHATPLLVLFHGLEGSSRSHYAQAFAHRARTLGWHFAVPHFRGCSGELNLAPRAYHSGDFEEIGWILARMRAQHAGPIVAAGVSLGGNALLRWAEEAGASAVHSLAAVAAISAPLDLAAGGRAIGEGLFNRQAYTRMFLRSMKPKALRKWAQHPGLFDRERLIAARDLYAFDDAFTAPLHGFRDTDDYWARGSAKPHLHRIRIPALVLNARNDPFVPGASLPAAHEVGAAVELWQPAQGGHVGFPGGAWPGHVLTMPEQVTAWLAARL